MHALILNLYPLQVVAAHSGTTAATSRPDPAGGGVDSGAHVEPQISPLVSLDNNQRASQHSVDHQTDQKIMTAAADAIDIFGRDCVGLCYVLGGVDQLKRDMESSQHPKINAHWKLRSGVVLALKDKLTDKTVSST